jgi:tetratricopeptide (TPR) repeat protein/predicted AlkP superfamily phosphohydrolase/phosphomutase
VLLIGVDGVDMGIVDRLIGQGRLPTFARLKREGAFGRLRSIEPLLSPIVWTTIATGRAPRDHGVFDFIEIAPDGQPTPITSLRRRVPALWNIAGQFGLASGFVGWYASFPAEKVKGFEVSDRLAFHQVSSARASAGSTWPEKLQQDLYRRFGAPLPDEGATRKAFLADPAARVTPDGEKRLEELAKIRATAEFYRRVVPDLARRERPDLLAVYFEAVDACGHLFMEDAPPRRPGVSDADFAAFGGTVDRCYEYQDGILAELLRLEGPSTVTIVVSDHGFKSGDRRPETSGRADTGLAPLWHQVYGVVFVHGRGVAAGRQLHGATVFDVAPTVLATLGVPLSRELPGRPLGQAFRAGSLPSPGTVAAYAPPPKRTLPVGASSDAEAVRRLAALGYLGGSARAVPHDPEGRTVSSYLNEGAARAADGDDRGALVAFGKALQLDPRNANALIYAARIYMLQGDMDRSREFGDRALAIKPDDSGVRLQRAAWAVEAGHLEMATAELDAASGIDDRLPLLHLLRARVAERRGRLDEALAQLALAERLTDSDRYLSEILVERAGILVATGRSAEADTALAGAAGIAPPQVIAGLRGNLALRRRDPVGAAALFRQAVAAGDRSPATLRKLGKSLAASGDLGGAESAFLQAVSAAISRNEIEGAYADLSVFYQFARREDEVRRALAQGTQKVPDSGPLWELLGASNGRAQRYDDAIAAYERAVALRPTALACKSLAVLQYYRRRDAPRAIALWKQSLTLDPNQLDVRDLLHRLGASATP